jgi:fructan beta-fructosidase
MKLKSKTLYFGISIAILFCATTCKQEITGSLSATYREPHRLQFHFSPPQNWMNDPNGMVFYDGEYHLFYQHYPDSNVWGPMHWGHAVSTDLVHWEHLPIALYPDSLGYIFSGSAVMDWKNTSGLGKPGKPPMIAIFTYHNPEGERAGRQDFQYQGIAFSLDKGRTWTKYAGNPVIPNSDSIRDFRDPKVIWHAPSQKWIMIFAAYDHLKIWSSKNLLEWNHMSDFGADFGAHSGVWECPDLFPIDVEGAGLTKWVLLVSVNPGAPNGGSGTQYFIGDFDGESFILDRQFEQVVQNGQAIWLDYGRDNYAGVTWSDAPHNLSERIFMGWMSNWDYAQVVPTEVWRSAMTLPRSLKLVSSPEGLRLKAQPVHNLASLRGEAVTLKNKDVLGVLDLGAYGLKPDKLELLIEFELPEDAPLVTGIELSNSVGERYRVGFSAKNELWFSDRRLSGDHSFSEKFAEGLHTAPVSGKDRKRSMHLFLDTAAAELFADEGTTVITDIYFPSEPFNRIHIFSENGQVRVTNATFYPLRSIWK